jgi:cell division protein FtsB
MVLLLLVVGLVVAMAVEPTRQLLEQRRRIEGMAADLGRLDSLNERLEARIERLKDPDYIEQQARARSDLVRPGEETFIVMPPTRKQQRRSAERKASKQEILARPEPSFIEGFFDFIGVG